MSSIWRNKNKLFTCFRPVAVNSDLVRPTPHPLLMHITAGGKEKTVKFNVVSDIPDGRCNVGCWGDCKKKKKKKTNPRRRLSSLLKRVLFDIPLRCRRNRETEEKETNSDRTPLTHVSRVPLQASVAEPEKVNRPAPRMKNGEEKREDFYSPCVGMSLLLVPLMVLMIWGKGLAIISASICLYLVPGILKGEVADFCKERDDRLKQSKKMVIMEGLLERDGSRNWRKLK